jgi:hypothetical protein
MGEGSGRQRGMTGQEGLRGDRAQRSAPPDRDRDLQAEIEDEMMSSGRTHLVPREGLVGAHPERRQGADQQPDDGLGSRVAPTRKAEVREATRHELERQVGQFAAGEAGGRLRQARSGFATREALDGIAAEADDLVAGRQLTAEGDRIPWSQRARGWLWEHRKVVATGAGAAALAVGCFTVARRLRS